jgi:hypothetical protein
LVPSAFVISGCEREWPPSATRDQLDASREVAPLVGAAELQHHAGSRKRLREVHRLQGT